MCREPNRHYELWLDSHAPSTTKPLGDPVLPLSRSFDSTAPSRAVWHRSQRVCADMPWRASTRYRGCTRVRVAPAHHSMHRIFLERQVGRSRAGSMLCRLAEVREARWLAAVWTRRPCGLPGHGVVATSRSLGGMSNASVVLRLRWQASRTDR